LRAVAAYFPATLVAYIIGSALSTFVIMAGLADMGMPVSLGDVAGAVMFDWLGLLGSYLPLVALSLLIALPVAAQLYRRLSLPRTPTYLLAGFVALIALHLIMEATLGLVGFAGVRSTFGLTLQGLAGAAAGAVFAAISGVRQ